MTNSSQQKRIIYFRYPGDIPYTFVEGSGSDGFVYRAFEEEKSIRIQGKRMPYKDMKLKVRAGSRPTSMNREQYGEAFKLIEGLFEDNTLKKIILSRVIESTVREVNVEHHFEKLCTLYPDAFVYLGDFGDAGVWGGATPEKLLSYHNNIGSTVALAGTKTTDHPTAWSSKERDEHAHVEAFIASLHLPGHSELQNKSAVYFSQAGHLFHLKSDFQFRIDSADLWDFVDRLHPTPAVCGLPRATSKEIISKIELHSRSLYTGFLGFVSADPTDKLELYVNLRCFQLRPGFLYSYVGGGITPASIEEDEWQETVEKSKTIGRIFQQSY